MTKLRKFCRLTRFIEALPMLGVDTDDYSLYNNYLEFMKRIRADQTMSTL
jgi:hypothetical protein